MPWLFVLGDRGLLLLLGGRVAESDEQKISRWYIEAFEDQFHGHSPAWG